MAPINTEDHIKERLEERRLKPSDASWDRIATRLDASQGQRKSNRVLYLAIAASFIGGLFVAGLFLRGDVDQQIATPTLVSNPTNDQDESNQSQDALSIDILTEAQEVDQPALGSLRETGVTASTPEEEISNDAHSMNDISLQTPRVAKTGNRVVVYQEPQKQPLKEGLQETGGTTDTAVTDAINEKIAEAVAQVDFETVTDAQIDALLLEAQKEIVSRQMFTKESNRVDATALLLDVEAALGSPSFRDQIFDALKEGFLKAREAVAARNQ